MLAKFLMNVEMVVELLLVDNTYLSFLVTA